MGLNIGACVKRQEEGYMSYGSNPKGTIAEVNEEFNAFLRGKFPNDVFSPNVTLNKKDQQYCFDVRLSYDWNGYDSTPMYLAILEFIMNHFNADYGIDISVYHSP